MKTTEWCLYRELAWIDSIIAPPENYKEETETFCKAIKEHSKIEVKTLLHLGCGSGIHDYNFKKHFDVTGVDISESMLEFAKKVNPELKYLYGDMRTLRLKESFDAVAIVDSIGHMVTLEDLQKAILTAYKHLKVGGVLFLTASIKEEFRENNFVYTGKKDDVAVTLFENNYIPDPEGTTYEATVVCLIRRKGKLEIHNDSVTIGLFKLEAWLSLLREVGFEVEHMRLDNSYDRFILEEGEYPLTIFVCNKPF